MKVTRTSGLPLDNVKEYKEELDAEFTKITEDLGPFETLTSSEKQGEFIRRFEEMKKEVSKKYVFEVDWDFETVMKSKTKLKELCNQYGVIAFARSSDGNALECFVVDSDVRV